jgi:hypothetical protein
MTALGRTLTALLVVLGLDLLLILVTGSSSLLGLHVGGAGFVVRLLLLAAVLVLRFYVLPPPGARLEGGRLVLLLLLLPTLAQFQYDGGRINGDGVMYYVYVRSLWKDFDLDLADEYAHYDLLRRSDLAVPTRTGLRRSIFSVGPAVVWTPFFFLGEVVARGQGLLGGEADLSGYGPAHRNAVALGSLLYGFAAVLLIHALLLRYFSAGIALGAALLSWWATFLHWYMVQQPTMSHAPSAFGSAFVVWLWERDRQAREPWGFFMLGLAMGLAMCLRWQNGVLLVLPGLELLARLRAEPQALARYVQCGALLGLGTLIGAVPQMAAWKALYGEWVLRYPPHGTDFLRFDHPFVLQTLFSSRHGLLSWTPVFWAAYLGFLPLLRRRPQLALPLLLPLLLMTYVNMCSGDWWAGGSYSNRRFDSLLPLLACGLAASLDGLTRTLRARPQLVLGLAALPFAAWNLLLVEQVRRGFVPRDDTVAFPRLVGNAARVFADAWGSPTTWPASWIFARQTGRSPAQYDLLVGRYLFYRQNNMGGHIALGTPGDDAMLGEGWGPSETVDGKTCRRLKGSGRLFAPLDVAEDLELRFRALAPGTPRVVAVWVNGREAGRIQAGASWDQAYLRVAEPFWHRELNEILLVGGEGVLLDAVDFVRLGQDAKRGFQAR